MGKKTDMTNSAEARGQVLYNEPNSRNKVVKKLNKLTAIAGLMLLLLIVGACSGVKDTEDEKAVRETFKNFCLCAYNDDAEQAPVTFFSRHDKKIAAKLFTNAVVEVAAERGRHLNSQEKQMLMQKFIERWDSEANVYDSPMNQNAKKMAQRNVDRILKENGKTFDDFIKMLERTPAQKMGLVIDPSGKKASIKNIHFRKEGNEWKLSMLEKGQDQKEFKRVIKQEMAKALNF